MVVTMNKQKFSLKVLFISVLFLNLLIVPCFSASKEPHAVLFREEFTLLTEWKPLLFPKIENHSTYQIVNQDNASVLQAESDASASGIVFKREFDVNTWPILKWRWKVGSVYEKGNALTKAGDDYPLRIYVLFKYDPETAGFWDKVKYESAKLIYGEYPPHSSLNYVWANRVHDKNIITNSFTDQAMLILMESGNDKVGQWREYEVNIQDDYKRAFGEKPPAIAGIAIMNDSDNTGEKSVSWVDYIEVSR